jgi:hypothetical protein
MLFPVIFRNRRSASAGSICSGFFDGNRLLPVQFYEVDDVPGKFKAVWHGFLLR